MPLKVVAANRPEPPYPPDTKVKGWKFTLDYERINQSDTWAMAVPDMKPWLLMLWHVAWQQLPAGSFSDDDRVIAAKIGMDERQFRAHRDILLRGWSLCSDGRLYHAVIVEQVIDYLGYAKRERDRKAAYRERKRQEKISDGVPRDTQGNPVGKTAPEPEPEPEPSSLRSDIETPGGVSRPQKPADHCPHQQIIDLYHEILPTLPRVRSWTGTRANKLRARWRERAEHRDLAWWRGFFEYVAESDFLCGRKKDWCASLEWIVTESKFRRIVEGEYHR